MLTQNLEKKIESLKALQHDHIVQYYGTERSDNNISVFIEYIPGVSIRVNVCDCGYSNRTSVNYLYSNSPVASSVN